MCAMARPSRRFEFSHRAEPFVLRGAPPHVHGVVWRPARPAAAVVLVHGLQSHAQWFADAADQLVDRGVSVYAVERRGSGSSPGVRGDIRRYEEWLEEVAETVRLARRQHPRLPVHLLGHCFGATLALATILSGRAAVDGLVMLTPGLRVLPRHRRLERLAIAAAVCLAPRRRFRVPQRDEDFTRDEAVLAWIRADRGGARTLTARALRQVARLGRAVRADLAHLEVPLLVIEAAHDRIADNRRNRAMLARALGIRRWTLASLDAEHFVLGGPSRDAAVELIANWAAGGREPVLRGQPVVAGTEV
jgi:acylglycerol lipase